MKTTTFKVGDRVEFDGREDIFVFIKAPLFGTVTDIRPATVPSRGVNHFQEVKVNGSDWFNGAWWKKVR